MNSEAPELLFVQLTPMGGTISYLSAPPDNRKPIYQYRRVDPPAAPEQMSNAGIKRLLNSLERPCGCTDHDPEVCLEGEVDEGSRYCHCKCHAPAPADERDKALAQQIIDESHLTNEEVVTLLGPIQTALATVRAEVWDQAIALAQSEAFERRMAYCVVEALESARGKVNQ